MLWKEETASGLVTEAVKLHRACPWVRSWAVPKLRLEAPTLCPTATQTALVKGRIFWKVEGIFHGSQGREAPWSLKQREPKHPRWPTLQVYARCPSIDINSVPPHGQKCLGLTDNLCGRVTAGLESGTQLISHKPSSLLPLFSHWPWLTVCPRFVSPSSGFLCSLRQGLAAEIWWQGSTWCSGDSPYGRNWWAWQTPQEASATEVRAQCGKKRSQKGEELGTSFSAMTDSRLEGPALFFPVLFCACCHSFRAVLTRFFWLHDPRWCGIGPAGMGNVAPRGAVGLTPAPCSPPLPAPGSRLPAPACSSLGLAGWAL